MSSHAFAVLPYSTLSTRRLNDEPFYNVEMPRPFSYPSATGALDHVAVLNITSSNMRIGEIIDACFQAASNAIDTMVAEQHSWWQSIEDLKARTRRNQEAIDKWLKTVQGQGI